MAPLDLRCYTFGAPRTGNHAFAWDYNITVPSFPMNLFAGMFKFKEAPNYPVPDVSKVVPKVDFSGLKPGAK